LWVCMEI